MFAALQSNNLRSIALLTEDTDPFITSHKLSTSSSPNFGMNHVMSKLAMSPEGEVANDESRKNELVGEKGKEAEGTTKVEIAPAEKKAEGSCL